MKYRLCVMCVAFALLAQVLPAWEGGSSQGAWVRAAGAAQAAYDCNSQSDLPAAECTALTALHQSTNGPGWKNQDGWLSSLTPCTWYGVSCSEGHVIALTLNDNQLNGTLPPLLGGLSAVEGLYLHGNQLHGSIPPELGNLSALQELSLANNQLSGDIPAQLADLPGLKILNLNTNQLTGAIPPQLGGLAALEVLYLSVNQLSGIIPPELGNLGELQGLYLSNNQLTGGIPPELANLSHLEDLHLHGNQLTGDIPAGLGELTALQELSLANNLLSGSIPPQLVDLVNLQILNVNTNQLTGAIPPGLGALHDLQVLYLAYNQLSGNIPPELGNLASLQGLYLSNNQLTGAIPSELGSLGALQDLDLSSNQLTGDIPAELGNLSALRELALASNQLNGNIPPELGGLTQLRNLNLNTNQLTGAIPASLGNLSALELLYLSANTLSEEIPAELGNLAALRQLFLNDNQLSGGIPPQLGNLANVQQIDLSANHLAGQIPAQLGSLTNLQWLILSVNQLSGAIPVELGALANLEQLHLYTNQLSGGIPAALGALPRLELLYLSENQLGGAIPPELGNLAVLEQLYLNANQLTGSLPPELGNLTQLQYLDLSDNLVGDALPLDLANLGSLDTFTFYATNLCVPDDAALQAWLAGLPNLAGTDQPCDALPPPPVTVDLPDNPPVPVDDQAAAYARLEANSTQTVTVRVEDGAIRFASFAVPVPVEVGVDPLARAQWFLNEYHDLLAIENPTADLQLIRRSSDGMHIFFRQLHENVPVFAGELAVHLDGDSVLSLNGEYVPRIDVPSIPTLSPALAEEVALAATNGGDAVVGDTQLRYVDLGLLGLADGETYLTWQVHVGRQGSLAKLETVFVDAFTGSIVFRVTNAQDNHKPPLDFDLEDGNDDYDDELCGLTDDDDIGANDAPPESVNANNHFHAVYNYWINTFDRNSYDDDEEQAEVNIHVQFRPATPGGPNSVNASYGLCDLFFFSRNTTRLDITGHEWTHAVDDSEGGLIYANQSGAIDESFADIFGYLVDPGNFLIGENSAFARAPVPGVAGCSATQAARDMGNPPCFNDPDHVQAATSGDGQGLRPAVANPNIGNDNGSVHTNSGINNKAAFLIIQGTGAGAFNGYKVRGIGTAKAQWLFYNVLVNRVTSGTNLQTLRNITVQEAIDLANAKAPGDHGFGDSFQDKRYDEACSVRNAYAAVGIGSGDINCDGEEDNVDPDADGDWVPNVRDNCPVKFNPGQADLDGDNVGDDCDPDMDNDGRANAADNCPRVVNPGWADWNNNGYGDACDDTDGDSVLDDRDNCRQTFNPLQENIDWDLGDRLGDVCDPDMDGDNWLNQADNCPVHRNPGQEDTSEFNIGLPRDGIGDACDLCLLISSPDNTDLDGDRLANPCDDDDDGDNWKDVDDNCPLIANEDQFDWDRNDIGFVCDPAERQAFGEILKGITDEKVEFNQDFIVPVPVCPECQASYLPDRYETVINVQAPMLFQAVVLDGAGDVVARTVTNATTQVLAFNPAPFTQMRFGRASTARGGEGALASGVAVASDELRYYLQIFPAPGTDLSQSYALDLSVTGGIEPAEVGKVFLPLVGK
jgi:Leucine-rich repeat (LRR) protein/Zn-dependent metalloprotease